MDQADMNPDFKIVYKIGDLVGYKAYGCEFVGIILNTDKCFTIMWIYGTNGDTLSNGDYARQDVYCDFYKVEA